jgi:hypothetical protein
MKGGGAVAVLLLAGLAGGCSENCQNTCARIYSENECGIVIPGVKVADSVNQCQSTCETALKQAGSMGTYNPYERHGSEPVTLENEKQAAAWMDCVWSTDCELLDPAEGLCAPI